MWNASFTRGVNHLIEIHAVIQRKHYYEVEPLGVCSIFWEKQVMIVCVQYALPYEWNIWTKQASLSLKKWRFPFKANVIRKELRRKAELYYKMYCIFPHLVFFCKNAASYLREYLVFTAISFEEVEVFPKKGHTRQMRGRMSFIIKGCIASFKHTCSFLARMSCFFIWGNILSSRQIVTCKQHVPLTTFFPGMKQFASTAILNVDHTLHIV